jgi:hypothetical protein
MEADASTLDAGAGRMVVDRLEVLDVHRIAPDTRVARDRERNVAHEVFHELRVLVGTLGELRRAGNVTYSERREVEALAHSMNSQGFVPVDEPWFCCDSGVNASGARRCQALSGAVRRSESQRVELIGCGRDFVFDRVELALLDHVHRLDAGDQCL